MPQTEQLTESQVARAAEILRAGGLVAFATETVYGLGGDATNGQAVARIFKAKGRPSFNPLIVHVPSLEHAKAIAHFSDQALSLARVFWPGALTLVLPKREDAGIADLVSAGLDTIAIRVPNHPHAQRLLIETGRPIAAPSANPSGQISPTTAAHVADGLGGKIQAILDGGACRVGLESTIIGVAPTPTLLRPGGIPVDEIETLLGAPLATHTETGSVNAPGQLASHYAPNSAIRLNVKTPKPNESYLGFGPAPCTLNLSQTQDLTEAAANLFSHLHKLDEMGRPIAVAPIPNHGLGRAINDRLSRAAAPKGE